MSMKAFLWSSSKASRTSPARTVIPVSPAAPGVVDQSDDVGANSCRVSLGMSRSTPRTGGKGIVSLRTVADNIKAPGAASCKPS